MASPNDAGTWFGLGEHYIFSVHYGGKWDPYHCICNDPTHGMLLVFRYIFMCDYVVILFRLHCVLTRLSPHRLVGLQQSMAKSLW